MKRLWRFRRARPPFLSTHCNGSERITGLLDAIFDEADEPNELARAPLYIEPRRGTEPEQVEMVRSVENRAREAHMRLQTEC
jgi:hypothetical protein